MLKKALALGVNIRINTPATISRPHSASLLIKLHQWQRLLRRKAWQKRLVRYGLLAANLIILIGIISLITFHNKPSGATAQAILSTNTPASNAINPLDQLSSADIAETVATVTNLPESTAVRNQADTVSADLAITAAENVVAAKPQIVSTNVKTRNDIQTYVSQPGDTVDGLATKFNVNSTSIQWSNSLSGNTIPAGTKLVIPPINGIVYTVKSGDTAQSLAQKYNASADQITAFNDAEINGLVPGEKIVIPNGQVHQAVTTPSYNFSYFGGTAAYGGDGYDFGYCTYWVALRRIQVGKPLPNNLGNASSWGYLARAYGLSTGNTPQVYAAVVLSTVGEGHVGFVESVNSDGSFTISEMNTVGWDRTDTRTISAAQASDYTYIY